MVNIRNSCQKYLRLKINFIFNNEYVQFNKFRINVNRNIHD